MSPRSLCAFAVLSSAAFAQEPPTPKFKGLVLDHQVQIGYGVAVADVDGDGAQDILLADKRQFRWYRNPGPAKAGDPAAWTKHVLTEALTEKDHVCIAAQDIDGDGKCEIAVGAEWNPSDTINSGAVFYLTPPADRTQPWTPVKLPTDPTTHRMRWLQLDEKKWGLAVAPLHGRGNKNGVGDPVKITLYLPPAETGGEWKTEVMDATMHMTHNFQSLPWKKETGPSFYLSGKEGFTLVSKQGAWTSSLQRTLPASPSGSGEIRVGKVRHTENSPAAPFITTVEPMHGNSLVVYTPDHENKAWKRQVLTDRLTDGHALAVGNLFGGTAEDIVLGWRGKPGDPQSTIGVAIWSPLDAGPEKWRETVIDPDGMACEDLALADFNGDGKLDIVASGRATKNLKIYLNETVKP